MNVHRIVGRLACVAVLVLGTTWLSAQAGQGGRGGRGSAIPQRDLLYAAVPGRVNDIGFGGIGILVFDASRGFRFVKRIPTWEYPASTPSSTATRTSGSICSCSAPTNARWACRGIRSRVSERSLGPVSQYR